MKAKIGFMGIEFDVLVSVSAFQYGRIRIPLAPPFSTYSKLPPDKEIPTLEFELDGARFVLCSEQQLAIIEALSK